MKEKSQQDSKKAKSWRILFVCLGNICRSPAAEGILKDALSRHGIYDWTVDSAGTGNYHIGDLPDMRMRQAAFSRGYRLTHRARQVRSSDFDDFDLIIGMDESNVRNLRRMAPTVEAEKKVVPMSRWLDPRFGYDYVPDPYYEGAEGFELVLNQLEDASERMIADLQ